MFAQNPLYSINIRYGAISVTTLKSRLITTTMSSVSFAAITCGEGGLTLSSAAELNNAVTQKAGARPNEMRF